MVDRTHGGVGADVRTDNRARGAFFTPEAIAEFLTSWAVRSPHATVLDPTCGEAAFLLAAGHRLRQLGAETATLMLRFSESTCIVLRSIDLLPFSNPRASMVTFWQTTSSRFQLPINSDVQCQP